MTVKIAAAASTTRVFFEQYKALIEEKGQVETEIALLNEELTRTIAELQPFKNLKRRLYGRGRSYFRTWDFEPSPRS